MLVLALAGPVAAGAQGSSPMQQTNVTPTPASTPAGADLGPAIEKAETTAKRWFFAFIAVLVIGGLLTAWLTYKVDRTGGKVRDLVKLQAEAQIQEAKRAAAEAHKEAADANTRLLKPTPGARRLRKTT
jgi:outer membrane murein-binding lipoprotein Lpp